MNLLPNDIESKLLKSPEVEIKELKDIEEIHENDEYNCRQEKHHQKCKNKPQY